MNANGLRIRTKNQKRLDQRMRYAFSLACLGTVLVVVTVFLYSCKSEPDAPGNLVIGTFSFSVESISALPNATAPECNFAPDSGYLDPGAFSAVISLDTVTGTTYLTQGNAKFAGSAGQDWSSGRNTLSVVGKSVERDLPSSCVCDGGICKGALVEQIDGKMYDQAQIAAIGGCAAIPGTEDAGVVLSDSGISEVRVVCAVLTDKFSPNDQDNACQPCQMTYALVGKRQ